MDRIEPTFSSVNINEELIGAKVKINNSLSKKTTSIILASPRRRYLGQFIDLLVTWGIFIVCLYTMNELSMSQDFSGVISVSLACIYLVFSDALPEGKSVGKRFLSMSVVDKETGKYCSLWQSFLRNILNPLIGVIDAIFILSKKRQRIGDMAADTIVIKNSLQDL